MYDKKKLIVYFREICNCACYQCVLSIKSFCIWPVIRRVMSSCTLYQCVEGNLPTETTGDKWLSWSDCTNFQADLCLYCFMRINLYYSLGKFSRWQTDDFFLSFPRKQNLTFHANCLQWRQFAWNVKTCFLGKIFLYVVCRKFYPAC